MKQTLEKQLKEFENYINKWERLDRQYNSVPKIPIYHFIKQYNILTKKIKLTKDYEKYHYKSFNK